MPVLGELEQAVMDALWRKDAPTSVRDVHEELRASRDIAYTTVMTVLDRLAKKGVLHRELDGRAWLYHPAQSRLDLHVAAVAQILDGLDEAERELLWRRLRVPESVD